MQVFLTLIIIRNVSQKSEKFGMIELLYYTLPDIFSILQHGEADGAFLIHIRLFLTLT